LDKTVNVRIFSVRQREHSSSGFLDALRWIANQRLTDRENDVEQDIVLRLERLEEEEDIAFGEMIRMQIDNLPSEAQRGLPIRPLGVTSIGHSTVFGYDHRLSILALQIARNGITSSRLGIYVGRLCAGAKFDILPQPNAHVLETLRSGRIRALQVKVAHPQSLEAVDAPTQSVTEGFRAFKQVLGTSNIDVTLSMERRDPDIQKGGVLGLFSWFRQEEERRPGNVGRLRAAIIAPDGERAEWLDLMEGQEGERIRLDLPGGDPERNYAVRKSFVRRVLGRYHGVVEGERE